MRLERLIQQLDADEPADRHRAVAKLTNVGTSLIPRLVTLMSEGTWRRRNAAALCLERLSWKPSGDTEYRFYLIARWEIRKHYEQLASASSPVTEYVLPLLSDPWESIREKALSLLETDTTGIASTGILEAVERGDLSGMSVVQVLQEKLNDVEAAERAIELLLIRKSVMPADLERLTKLLGERFDHRFIPSLSDDLRSNDANIRLFAARALHRLGWQPNTLEDRLRFTLGGREWTAFAVCFREKTVESLPIVVRLLKNVEHNRETFGYSRESDDGRILEIPVSEIRLTLADGKGQIIFNPMTRSVRDSFLPQGALRTIIQLGLPKTERALKDVLNAAGDKHIAVDYLNCGNKRLEMAARNWASQHNYEVFQLPQAEAIVRWGEIR